MMRDNVRDLALNNGFKEEDAKEIALIIGLEEGLSVRDTLTYDYSSEFDCRGARWGRQKIEKYMNQDCGDDYLTIYAILRQDFVYQLASGLIVTWDF